VTVRPARRNDAASIAPLLGQLGYPTEVGEVGRLDRLTHVLIAELGDEIAGLVAYEFVELLHRPQAQCRITALVVHADQRRRGDEAATGSRSRPGPNAMRVGRCTRR